MLQCRPLQEYGRERNGKDEGEEEKRQMNIQFQNVEKKTKENVKKK